MSKGAVGDSVLYQYQQPLYSVTDLLEIGANKVVLTDPKQLQPIEPITVYGLENSKRQITTL